MFGVHLHIFRRILEPSEIPHHSFEPNRPCAVQRQRRRISLFAVLFLILFVGRRILGNELQAGQSSYGVTCPAFFVQEKLCQKPSRRHVRPAPSWILVPIVLFIACLLVLAKSHSIVAATLYRSNFCPSLERRYMHPYGAEIMSGAGPATETLPILSAKNAGSSDTHACSSLPIPARLGISGCVRVGGSHFFR